MEDMELGHGKQSGRTRGELSGLAGARAGNGARSGFYTSQGHAGQTRNAAFGPVRGLCETYTRSKISLSY